MALRIWLPLNGSLENKGISNGTVATTMTDIWSDNGKIGKCVLSNAKASYTFSELTNITNFSISYWIYIDSSVAIQNWADIWGINCVAGSSSTVIRDEFKSTAGTHQLLIGKDSTIGSNTNTYAGTGMNDSNAKDKWVHIALVKDNSTVKVYTNGILTNTINSSTFESTPQKLTGYVIIGNTSSSAAKLNDFRIYDHCLSPLEVKEISQGLILHYKLDGFSGGVGDNILTGTATQTTLIASNTGFHENGTWSPASGGNGIHAIINIQNDTPVSGVNWGFQITNNTSGNRDFAQRNQPYKNGVTYTVSWYMRGTGKYLVRQWNITDSKQMQAKTGNVNTTDWTYYTWTFTANEELETDECTLHLGATGNTSLLEWCAMKMEIGSIATPWSPAPEDLGIDTTKIPDSSGYGNDGEVIGNLITETGSSRYKIATHINSTSSKIKIDNLQTLGFGNSYTFTWWAKVSSVTPMHWGFANGVRLNGMYTGRLWNTGDGNNNPLYNPGTTTQVTAPTVNVWHHWAMVGNGTECLVYQDGELWAEAKTYKSISGTTIYINGWDSGTSYCSDNLSMSDFRIYATALSAEDIATLYHTPAQIDNLGGIHGFEMNEIETSNLSDFTLVSSNWVSDGVTATYSEEDMGSIVKIVPSSGSKRIYHSVSNVWTNGKSYIVSMIAKADTNGAVLRASRSMANFAPNFSLTTSWKKYYGIITSTVTTDSGTLSIDCQTSTNYYIADIKLEEANLNLISISQNGIIKENWIDENNFSNNAKFLKESSIIIGNNFVEK